MMKKKQKSNLTDCKREIVEMVKKLENEKMINMIYGFVKTLYYNEKAED